MAQTVAMAKRKNAPSLVFTFSPAPANVLRPEYAPAPLVDAETKRALIARAGIDALIEFPTTREFLNQSADAFFRDVVVSRLAAVGLVEGANFSFGRGREGSGDRLVALASQFNVALEIVAPIAIATAGPAAPAVATVTTAPTMPITSVRPNAAACLFFSSSSRRAIAASSTF